MSLIDLFKRKKTKKQECKVLLAMAIFNNGDSFDVHQIIAHFESHWGVKPLDKEGNKEVASFRIDGETVALAEMQVQIPWADIEGTAQYAYNWPKASEDLKHHTGHAFATLMAGQKSRRERCEILSKVMYSIFKTSGAIGVYLGSESLLIPKKQYIDSMDILENGDFPVSLWIYIGLRQLETGNCAYTYGLKEFNKQEIEIINSKLSLEDLYEFLLNISAYIIGNDVTLKSGETIGLSQEQKIPVIISKGSFVEGESIKLSV
ncbi:DUF4261 domain-containing protein [Mucilaginibacter psychrotolerans]|uniref:DUF4261 domain-containing protein n=1 Tax=Mucilaginibacter psychrotolerans TaxID=1524096 RepID=A0A4Y8SD58_9SPHI|nr:DUF4261 domain-containing protein [Mucilaginibacter psychrotolerans]TFF36852.1 DUF4261 domain-containing protein [Mucilaginibacter psychrotolerans]